MQCTSLCKQHVQSVLQWYSRTKQCKRQVEHISGTQVKHNNENGNTVCTTGTECKWRAIRTPPERNRNTSGTQLEQAERNLGNKWWQEPLQNQVARFWPQNVRTLHAPFTKLFASECLAYQGFSKLCNRYYDIIIWYRCWWWAWCWPGVGCIAVQNPSVLGLIEAWFSPKDCLMYLVHLHTLSLWVHGCWPTGSAKKYQQTKTFENPCPPTDLANL